MEETLVFPVWEYKFYSNYLEGTRRKPGSFCEMNRQERERLLFRIRQGTIIFRHLFSLSKLPEKKQIVALRGFLTSVPLSLTSRFESGLFAKILENPLPLLSQGPSVSFEREEKNTAWQKSREKRGSKPLQYSTSAVASNRESVLDMCLKLGLSELPYPLRHFSRDYLDHALFLLRGGFFAPRQIRNFLIHLRETNLYHKEQVVYDATFKLLRKLFRPEREAVAEWTKMSEEALFGAP